MPEIEVIRESPLTRAEVTERMKAIKKNCDELSFRATKTHEYLEVFGKADLKTAKALREGLEKLEIQRLKERHIAKLVEIAPEDGDSIKAILSSENITLKQDDLQKIVDCLKNAKK
tara:strand:+ start:1312 stop:1659 length:348 start_codon:yes stop_codon:yes gene_type:complete